MNVKTLCLGTLCLTDATGYDIKKMFEAAFNHFHSASYGSIYPALNQLEDEGLISRRVEPGERHPDRKIYSITEQGRRILLDELAACEPTEVVRSEFMVLMFFAHLLPTDRLAYLLDRIETEYREKLAYLEGARDEPCHTSGIRFTIDIGIATLRAKLGVIVDGRDELLATHKDPPQMSCEESA